MRDKRKEEKEKKQAMQMEVEGGSGAAGAGAAGLDAGGSRGNPGALSGQVNPQHFPALPRPPATRAARRLLRSLLQRPF